MSCNTTIATQRGIPVTDVYRVLKNGRKLPNKVFGSYDAARSWVRRKLRCGRKLPGYVPIAGTEFIEIDLNDLAYRTPQLALHGYSIKRVEV